VTKHSTWPHRRRPRGLHRQRLPNLHPPRRQRPVGLGQSRLAPSGRRQVNARPIRPTCAHSASSRARRQTLHRQRLPNLHRQRPRGLHRQRQLNLHRRRLPNLHRQRLPSPHRRRLPSPYRYRLGRRHRSQRWQSETRMCYGRSDQVRSCLVHNVCGSDMWFSEESVVVPFGSSMRGMLGVGTCSRVRVINMKFVIEYLFSESDFVVTRRRANRSPRAERHSKCTVYR
jgi:hypothetical protein